jgi:hypothetical protein
VSRAERTVSRPPLRKFVRDYPGVARQSLSSRQAFSSVGRALYVAVLFMLTSLVGVPCAAAGSSRTVQLTVAIQGNGTVRLSPGGQLTCAASCKRTFLVRAAARVTLTAQAGSGWKFGAWAGACRLTSPRCKIRVSRSGRVGVTFIPPGAQTNPIQVGTFANIDDGGYGGWRLKVVSTHLEGRDFVLLLSATAIGSDLWAVQLDANLFIMGKTARCNVSGLTLCGGEYALWGSCTPHAPDFFEQGVLTSVGGLAGRWVREGQTITGYACFRASGDMPTLLFTEPPLRTVNPPLGPPYPPDAEARWFALK